MEIAFVKSYPHLPTLSKAPLHSDIGVRGKEMIKGNFFNVDPPLKRKTYLLPSNVLNKFRDIFKLLYNYSE